MRAAIPRVVPRNRSPGVGASVALAISLLSLSVFPVGCGNNSVPGVYEYMQDTRGYNRRGDIVVFS